VFLAGVRTGFGKFGGTLKDFSATQLGVIAAKHAVERAKVDPNARHAERRRAAGNGAAPMPALEETTKS